MRIQAVDGGEENFVKNGFMNEMTSVTAEKILAFNDSGNNNVASTLFMNGKKASWAGRRNSAGKINNESVLLKYSVKARSHCKGDGKNDFENAFRCTKSFIQS